MNNWSDEEKACALTSILRDSAAAILENLSSSDHVGIRSPKPS
nr:unnamed protein product [Callosobruchus chinensis]